MSDSNGNVVNLDDHRDPVAAVIEVRGVKHQVLKPKRRQYQQMANIDTMKATALYDMVHDVVPSLPDEDLADLDKETCWVIIALSSNGIGVVEQLFPNARSPEPTSSTSPG